MHPDHSRSIIRVCWFPLLGILVGLLAGCTTQSISEPESQFQQMIGARIDPQLTLETNHKKYTRSSVMIFWVINRKENPVYFATPTLGFRAYKFDEPSKDWVLVGETSSMDPHPVIVNPGPLDPMTSSIARALDVQATGKIRLVVIGYESPNNQESKIAAFTGIEITPSPGP